MIETLKTIGLYLLLIILGFFLGSIWGFWQKIEFLNSTIEKKEEEIKKAEEKGKDIIAFAQERANRELKELRKIEEEKNQEKREAVKAEWEKAQQTLEETKKTLEAVKTLKKITKERNWKHLHNLAISNVTKQQAKAELIKATREVLYLQNALKDLQEEIEIENAKIITRPSYYQDYQNRED